MTGFRPWLESCKVDGAPSGSGWAIRQEIRMNWTQIEGQWHQLQGQMKSRWAKLTDDDLKNAAGKREQLSGKLQEHYGIVKEEAERQIDGWIAKLTPESKTKKSD
jgi:uncharacterized protein YjbJ (UPF0337 family)